MAYGSCHLLAFTETGRLFAWGNNEYSQIGDGFTDDRLIPTLIEDKLAAKKIVQVCSTNS